MKQRFFNHGKKVALTEQFKCIAKLWNMDTRSLSHIWLIQSAEFIWNFLKNAVTFFSQNSSGKLKTKKNVTISPVLCCFCPLGWHSRSSNLRIPVRIVLSLHSIIPPPTTGFSRKVLTKSQWQTIQLSLGF